jgi:hypothetical protein
MVSAYRWKTLGRDSVTAGALVDGDPTGCGSTAACFGAGGAGGGAGGAAAAGAGAVGGFP